MRAKRGAKKDRYSHFCGFDEEEKRKMFALEDSGLLYQVGGVSGESYRIVVCI